MQVTSALTTAASVSEYLHCRMVTYLTVSQYRESRGEHKKNEEWQKNNPERRERNRKFVKKERFVVFILFHSGDKTDTI